MKIPDNFYRTSIKALILNDNNDFLLIREDDGNWEFPGGGMNFGEKPEDTLKREILEEMGLKTAKIGFRPLYFNTFINLNGIWAANVFFDVKLEHFNFIPTPECREIGFFNKDTANKIQILPSVTAFMKVFYQNSQAVYNN